MPEKLTPQEVAILIRARRLLKEKGLSPDTDIKSLCEEVASVQQRENAWELFCQFLNANEQESRVTLSS